MNVADRLPGRVRRLADLRRQATTDDLTGLPNRRSFYAAGPRQLVRTPRSALLLLDLDGFRDVRSLGHHVGDQLLVQVGARLAAIAQGRGMLARLGGDEFALLLAGAGRVEAGLVAGEVGEALREPFALADIMVSSTASIGIALSPEHGEELSVLLRRSDIALYKAKRCGSGHEIYREADDAEGDERLRTLHELRNGLDAGEMVVHYQPKLELSSGAVRSVEALVRWQHRDRGLLAPADFLPLVEESGLMSALTTAVLTEVLDQAVRWRECGRYLSIAVNLSPSCLVDAGLPAQVARLLASRDLPGSVLKVEITEETLMVERDRARHVLHQLRQQGLGVSLDDFGTGYSSLAYLRELPIDELKLDKSFVSTMSSDHRAAALVVGMVSLARSLDLRMVAEGVQDAATLEALTQHGCDEAQGFHVSRPVPAEALDAWLDARDART